MTNKDQWVKVDDFIFSNNKSNFIILDNLVNLINKSQFDFTPEQRMGILKGILNIDNITPTIKDELKKTLIDLNIKHNGYSF